MESKLFPRLLLALVGAMISTSGVTAQTKFASELLCEGKSVRLAQKTDLFQIESQFANVASSLVCPSHIRSAVLELAELLRVPHTGLCTMEMAQRIKNFYLEYLDSPDRLRDKINFWSQSKKPKLPKNLEDFALAYGLRVGGVCKQFSYDVLVKRKELSEIEDYQPFGEILSDDGPLSRIVIGLTKIGDVPLPSDFASQLGLDENAIERIYIQLANAKTVSHWKQVCEKRLQPIYEQLILPHNVMVSAGFDYQDYGSKFMIRNYWPQVERWSRLVFLCEGLKLLEPVEYLDGDDKKKPGTVRILTKEEADDINQKLGRRNGRDDELEQAKFNMSDYTNDFNMPDVILGENERFAEEVARVSDYRKQARRLRGNVIHAALELLQENISEGNLEIVATAPIETLMESLTGVRSSVGDLKGLIVRQLKQKAKKVAKSNTDSLVD